MRQSTPTVLQVYHGEATSIVGASTSLYYFLRAIDHKRYQPILLCHLRGEGASRFDHLDVPVVYHRIPRFMHVKGDYATLLSVRKLPHLISSFIPDLWLAKYIRANNVRLVHLHSSVQVSCALTARWVGVPVVWHIRECFHEGMFGIRRRVFESIIRAWSDAIICISEDEARPFADLQKTHVIYNSVDFSLVDAAQSSRQRVRAQMGLDDATCVIGMIGALASAKGIYDVVVAAERVVRESSVPVKFLMVGPSRPTERYERNAQARMLNVLGLGNVDGRAEMESLIRVKNLQAHFVFAGAQSNGLEFMAAMDMVLFASHMDALGRPAFEASALGKPVIATSKERATRIVVDGETGILVPPGDPASLAEAILHLLNRPDEMARLGRAGYAYAREHFDSHQHAQQIMQVYDDVLSS